jgi:hypothetical protein
MMALSGGDDLKSAGVGQRAKEVGQNDAEEVIAGPHADENRHVQHQ